MTNDLDVLQIDSAYLAFPAFEVWLDNVQISSARWDRAVDDLAEIRQKSKIEVLDRAFEVAKRAAAFDTGAIENLYETDRGFTYSVAFETAKWETDIFAKGEQVRSLFKAQLDAYEYVLSLATKNEFISEAAVRQLLQIVCGAQDSYRVVTQVGFQEQPLPKGQYKSLPNHVLTREGEAHAYAPVDVTPSEMYRLMQEIRGVKFNAAHPILQAAYVHYCFVVIHPFADGNGRVARALASIFTYRATAVPIMILSEAKVAYLNSLASADQGAPQQFVDFLLYRALDTLQLVVDSAKRAGAVDSLATANALSALYVTKGGFTHEDVDTFGEKLVTLYAQELRKQLSTVMVPQITSSAMAPKSFFNIPTPDTHRKPLNSGSDFERLGIIISLSTPKPADASASRSYVLAVPKDASGRDDILLFSSEGDHFSARIDEITPAVSGVLMMRLQVNAERVVSELLFKLQQSAQDSLSRLR